MYHATCFQSPTRFRSRQSGYVHDFCEYVATYYGSFVWPREKPALINSAAIHNLIAVSRLYLCTSITSTIHYICISINIPSKQHNHSVAALPTLLYMLQRAQQETGVRPSRTCGPIQRGHPYCPTVHLARCVIACSPCPHISMTHRIFDTTVTSVSLQHATSSPYR